MRSSWPMWFRSCPPMVSTMVEKVMLPRSGWLTGLLACSGRALVVGRPLVLVKRLHDVVLFGERLAQAESEDGLAVGEMAHDVSGAPLAGCGRRGGVRGADFLCESLQTARRVGQDGEGVLTIQEFRVGVSSCGDSGHGCSLSTAVSHAGHPISYGALDRRETGSSSTGSSASYFSPSSKISALAQQIAAH